jgi:hypothetical protein
LIVKRGRPEQCRVSVLFALLAATRINAPAVPNDEHNRASHTSRKHFADEPAMDKQFFVSVEFLEHLQPS